MTNSNDENWKFKEKVVTILERSIYKEATVERNVHLPVLTSAEGAKRQCDVVITSGVGPRKTRSIVEVQDRKEKLNITIFDGWVVKMRDVGAQHLICVTKSGYTSSVVEKARNIGPTIRLMSLKQLEDQSYPFPHSMFQMPLNYIYSKDLSGIDYVVASDDIIKVQDCPISRFDVPCIRYLDGNPISLMSLANEVIFQNSETFAANINEFRDYQQVELERRFPENGPATLMLNDGSQIELFGVVFTAKIKLNQEKIVWQHESYEQQGYGQLAWASVGHANTEQEPVKIIVPLMTDDDGVIEMGKTQVIAPGEMMMQVGDIRMLLSKYSDKE